MKRFTLSFIITYCLVFLVLQFLQIDKKSKEVIDKTTSTTTIATTTTTTTTTKKITKKIVKKTTKKVATASYTEYQNYAKQVGNYDDSQMSCLINLWNKESGWNPNSRNRSTGACGIPQAYPCSKIQKQQGSNDWKAQIRWGIDYIKNRYSTPCGAWGHFKKKGWY